MRFTYRAAATGLKKSMVSNILRSTEKASVDDGIIDKEIELAKIHVFS